MVTDISAMVELPLKKTPKKLKKEKLRLLADCCGLNADNVIAEVEGSSASAAPVNDIDLNV